MVMAKSTDWSTPVIIKVQSLDGAADSVAENETLQTFADQPILLAVSSVGAEQMPDLPSATITYKTALPVKDVLERLQAISLPREKW